MSSVVGAAASGWVAGQLSGPARRVPVLHSSPTATYVRTADGVVGLLARDAVAVPIGLRSTLIRIPRVDRIQVGADRFVVGDLVVRVTRLVDPRVHAGRPADPAAVAAAAARLSRVDVPADAGPVAPEHMRGSDVEHWLGRGPGLTPYGDDVLAGYLVGCHAFGLPAPDVAGADQRTTALSAALLARAVLGEAPPQVHGLVRALRGPGDVAIAIDRLFAVGASSGHGLAVGVVRAAQAGMREVAA